MNNDNEEKLINYNYYYDDSFKYKSSTRHITNKLDYQKTVALKNIIENEFNTNTKWIFKKDGVLNYTIVLKNSFKHELSGNELDVEYITQISFSENAFSKLYFTSFIFQDISDNKLQKIIQQKNKEIKETVKDLYDKVSNAVTIENYFFEPVQFCYGSLSGFYDFDYIQVDAGEKQETYSNPEIIKMKIKYNKIITEGIKETNTISSSMNSDRLIARNLIQLLLRFPLEDMISDGTYYMRKNFNSVHNFQLDEDNKGKMYPIDRSKIINNDFIGFPSDSADIIKKFYSLEYDKKNIFLQSCISYTNGLKSKSTRSIAYFVLAIENIANYHSKPSHQILSQGVFNKKTYENEGKKSLIYKTINNVYGEEIVSEYYINIVYKIRSEHFHEGIENSDLLTSGMGINEGDDFLVDSIERLVHSFLIKWLLIN